MAKSSLGFFQALKTPKMGSIFLLGISSGIPFALTWGTLQAWMTDAKIDLKTIGLFALLRIPFSLKFLWSPVLDRYSLGFSDRRRSWAVIMQALLALSFFLVGFCDPSQQALAIVVLALCINFFSASQDIVLDAYRREVLKDEELGLGSGVFVNGYLVAFRWISGALAILLSAYIPWGTVYKIFGGVMLLMIPITLKAPRAEVTVPPPRSLREAIVEPIREYFSRKTAFTILAFIVLYKLGDNLALSMTIPFILKTGFTKEEYVAIAKVWGLVATMLGTTMGGYAVMKWGERKSLWIMGIIQALAVCAFSLLAWTGRNIPALIAVIGFENLAIGMGTSAYSAFMARVTNTRFTATQFALLSSLMAIPGVIFASRTGALAESLGWTAYFLVCALFSIPGLCLIPFLEGEPKTASGRWFVRTITTATALAGVYALIVSSKEMIELIVKSLH